MKKRYLALAAAGIMGMLLAGCSSKPETPANSANNQADGTQAESKNEAGGDEHTDTPSGGLNLSGRHWKIGGQVRQTSLYLYMPGIWDCLKKPGRVWKSLPWPMGRL